MFVLLIAINYTYEHLLLKYKDYKQFELKDLEM